MDFTPNLMGIKNTILHYNFSYGTIASLADTHYKDIMDNPNYKLPLWFLNKDKYIHVNDIIISLTYKRTKHPINS